MSDFFYAFDDFIRNDTVAWILLGVIAAAMAACVVIASRTPRGKQGGWKKVTDE